MKKPLVLFLLLAPLFLFAEESFQFRGLQWGASMEDVTKKEGNPDKSIDESEYYASKYSFITLRYASKNVSTYQGRLEYCFIDNKFALAGYNILGISQPAMFAGTKNPSAFIEAYLDLQGKLSGLYGKAKKEGAVDKIDKNASALKMMQVQNNAPYETEWEYKKTVIRLNLYYYEESWNLSIMYISPLFTNVLKELKEKRDKKSESNTDGL